MPFPDEDLQVTAAAAFGADLTAAPTTWNFTDLSERLLPTPISISWGTAAGAASTQTSRASIRLSNDDGWLTPLLPTSPYWPNVDTGTPFYIDVRTDTTTRFSDTFTRTVASGWGTSTSGVLWTPAADAASFAVNGTQGTMSFTAANTVRQALTPRVDRDVDITFDAAWSAVALGTANLVGPLLRYNTAGGTRFVWPTAEFNTLGQLQVKVRAFGDGAYTDLGQVTVPAAAYTAAMLVRTRVQVVRDRVRMRAWPAAGTEPDLWHLDVENRLVSDAGQMGFCATVLLGNTNTYPLTAVVDNITVVQPPYPRLQGYISDIRPTYLPAGDGTTWSEVVVEVAGISSRMEKQDAPAYSPMRRGVELASIPPVAYWPLEDVTGATYGAPAFPGHPKMVVEGPAVFGFLTGVTETSTVSQEQQYLIQYGTKPTVSVAAGARLSALVPLSAVTSEWEVACTARLFAPEAGVGDIRILQWHTPGGSFNRWALVALSGYGYEVRGYNDAAGTVTTVVTTDAVSYPDQSTYEVEAVQNGPNIDVQLNINSSVGFPGSAAGTMAAVSKIFFNPDQKNTTASVTPNGLRFVVGHARVVDNVLAPGVPFYYDTDLAQFFRADSAWAGEAAHKRVERLCAEEGVPCTVLGDPYSTGVTLLGPQQEGTFTELLHAAVDAESGGLLVEERYGYTYLPRTARYNRPVDLTVDLATYARSEDTAPDQVLVPQLNSRTATVWTVERTNGSSGTYAAPAAYRQHHGTIPDGVTLDLLSDSDTDDHAAWRVHLGIDAADAYYPSLPVDLAANPDLVEDWLVCTVGSRVQRTNQPVVAGYATIDQVLEGITELLGPRTWSAEANASPAQLWDVAVTDDPVLGKADTDGSELQAASSSATTLLVDVTAGPRWTTDPAQMPIYVTAAGEDMRIDAIAGTSNPQTLTVVRGLNGFTKTIAAGTPVSLTNPSRAAL